MSLRPMPQSVEEARKELDRVFRNQPVGGWDERDRRVYAFQVLGEEKDLKDCSTDEIRALMKDVVASRMELYKKR